MSRQAYIHICFSVCRYARVLLPVAQQDIKPNKVSTLHISTDIVLHRVSRKCPTFFQLKLYFACTNVDKIWQVESRMSQL